MASDLSFVEFIAEQMEQAGVITYRKMFGEYAIYCNKKVVALVCDNQLFVKPTEGGRSFIGDVIEAPAYPGAKPSFLIEDKLEDREWMGNLIRITEKELPEPKPKKKKKRSKKYINIIWLSLLLIFGLQFNNNSVYLNQDNITKTFLK